MRHTELPVVVETSPANLFMNPNSQPLNGNRPPRITEYDVCEFKEGSIAIDDGESELTLNQMAVKENNNPLTERVPAVVGSESEPDTTSRPINFSAQGKMIVRDHTEQSSFKDN